MCPYARFQSAMFDRNTLIIAYDPLRGEPRGPRKRGLGSVLERGRGLLDKVLAYDYVFRAGRHPSAATQAAHAKSTVTWDGDLGDVQPLPKFAAEELGDCIDCTICVQVCPTGIDIRNGLQYECIACGACIDACDEVMAKVGYPKGLIRYDTQNGIDGKGTKVLRPRIFVYGILLLGFMAAWAVGVGTRDDLIVEALRDRNALYRETADGGIENGYTLKLVNKSDSDRAFRITVESEAAAIELRDNDVPVHAKAGSVISVPVIVVSRDGVSGRKEVRFVVESEDGTTRQVVDSSFFGPM
ncbi:MAG: hypothetical protein NVV60_02200 [Luteimonas sp.]|nr:hypothetical protein [Luteimonas sp.]